MKSKVFVLVPIHVPPAEISDYVYSVLRPHSFDQDTPTPEWRYDYLVGALDESFEDSVAEGRLPPDIRRSFAGNICERGNLPSGMIPGALITADGAWHDLFDFGWKMTKEPSDENCDALARWEGRYRELIGAYEQGWVVAVWAHS